MKKTILIADDEKPSREMLKNIIDWDRTDYIIIKEAENGKEALEYYREYGADYIITDIQMPIMDGLELIKSVKQINKEQNMIVLSCHEKFSYAREAMRYGVKDYLIKDMLTPEDLLEALNSYQRLKDQNNEEPLKVNIETNKTTNTNSNYNVAYAIRFDREVKDLGEAIERELCNYFNINKTSIRWSEDEVLCIIMPIEQIASQLMLIYECQKIAGKIRKVLEKCIEAELTIGISRGFLGTENIENWIEEARETCKYRIFLGTNKNIFYNTVFSQVKKFNPEKIEENLSRIAIELEKEEYDNAIEWINITYQKDLKGFMQYNYIKYVNSRTLSVIVDFIKTRALSYETIFNQEFIPLYELEEKATIEDIISWFQGKIENISKAMHFSQSTKYSLRVVQAQNLIKNNYKTVIGLNEIAENLGVHKVYLSRIFKEETGKNITQYIQEIRIEEAKRLLANSSMSISEIAEELNYPHPQQLSVAFKKETKMTPKEYRKRIFKQ